MLTVQILTNDVQVLILGLSYFITNCKLRWFVAAEWFFFNYYKVAWQLEIVHRLQRVNLCSAKGKWGVIPTVPIIFPSGLMLSLVHDLNSITFSGSPNFWSELDEIFKCYISHHLPHTFFLIYAQIEESNKNIYGISIEIYWIS